MTLFTTTFNTPVTGILHIFIFILSVIGFASRSHSLTPSPSPSLSLCRGFKTEAACIWGESFICATCRVFSLRRFTSDRRRQCYGHGIHLIVSRADMSTRWRASDPCSYTSRISAKDEAECVIWLLDECACCESRWMKCIVYN